MREKEREITKSGVEKVIIWAIMVKAKENPNEAFEFPLNVRYPYL